MASFDIVSDLDMQEVDNAVNQTSKEIGTRFDFRGGKSSIELDKETKKIKIMADDDFKLRSIHQMLEQKMAKRGLDLRGIEYGAEEQASGGVIRQQVTLKSGLEKEGAKEVTRVIKDSKLKVNVEIQDKQVRVTAKKIDDLQAVISLLKENKFKIPLQFVNMRS